MSHLLNHPRSPERDHARNAAMNFALNPPGNPPLNPQVNYHQITLGASAPQEINVVVEIPRGSSNKIEYDPTIGAFRLDRVLYSPLYYPCEYGFAPNTLFDDGDPLDILVLTSQPTFTGCILTARPVAVLKMSDDKGMDDKILAVSARDPRFERVTSLADVSEHRLKEILHFFAVYKNLEDKEVDIHGWEDENVARALLQQYRCG